MFLGVRIKTKVLTVSFAVSLVSPLFVGLAQEQGTETTGAVTNVSPTANGGVTKPVQLAMGPSDRVRVRRLDDIALGNWNGVSDMTGSDSVCVFSSTTIYTVVARGQGPGGAFELGNGNGDTLAYVVEWQDDQGGNVTLAAAEQSAPFSAQTNSASCQGGTNAVIGIRITAANAAQAVSGSYSGRLFLEISPSN